jgi:hypothetical protein
MKKTDMEYIDRIRAACSLPDFREIMKPKEYTHGAECCFAGCHETATHQAYDDSSMHFCESCTFEHVPLGVAVPIETKREPITQWSDDLIGATVECVTRWIGSCNTDSLEVGTRYTIAGESGIKPGWIVLCGMQRNYYDPKWGNFALVSKAEPKVYSAKDVSVKIGDVEIKGGEIAMMKESSWIQGIPDHTNCRCSTEGMKLDDFVTVEIALTKTPTPTTYEHTVSGTLEFRDDKTGPKVVEIPPPEGEGWEKGVTVQNDTFIPQMYEYGDDLGVTHEAGRMILHEYRARFKKEDAKIVQYTHWTRTVTETKAEPETYDALRNFPLLLGVE